MLYIHQILQYCFCLILTAKFHCNRFFHQVTVLSGLTLKKCLECQVSFKNYGAVSNISSYALNRRENTQT